MQWHFVHTRKDGSAQRSRWHRSRRGSAEHFPREDYKEIEKQWQQIQQEFEESKRKVQAQRETVAIMNQQRLALDREEVEQRLCSIDLDDDSSPGRLI